MNKMLLALGVLLYCCAGATELDRYNVVWDSPSRNASGSMPIGNGEIGLNVWVEEGGDLLFYISRTDSWSEACRLLKLGRVRLRLGSKPFAAGAPFRQELRLAEGCIQIDAGPADSRVQLKVFVDANAPVIHILGRCDRAVEVQAALENWRTEEKVLKGEELGSSWTMQQAPSNVVVRESADVVRNPGNDIVLWYHRNGTSVVPFTLKHQGLESLAELVHDPILRRTFGGRMAAKGFTVDGPASIRSLAATQQFDVQIAAHCSQAESLERWEAELTRIARRAEAGPASARSTARWWQSFWDRSWIFIEGDSAADRSEAAGSPSPITRAWILQRWMTACAGRGNYPIKFNGSIFTVDPEFTQGPNFNADWRRWGDCFWWQNTRFPGYAAIAAGDYEECHAIFRLYREMLPLCKARAKLYYHADGAYFPETVTLFGTYANNDYGWDRTGHAASEVLCPWWCYAWQQGLELVMLMQDYFDHTGDRRFLRDELLPMAREVLAYYDSRFPRNAVGKLQIAPTQAVETYWYGVTNDMPSVAGLHAVLSRLQALPKAEASAADHALWDRLLAATPPVPVRRDGDLQFLLPAEHFNPKRSNVENPEIYAIWPFRLFGVGKPDLAAAIEGFRRRQEKSVNGWSYDGQCAAILGLVPEAKKQILAKVTNSNPRHRFPAMWGPNYDWLPDQDHGGNIQLTLEHMLLVSDGRGIQVLPAWPKEWNVHFKLHAPQQTTVEGRVQDGRLVQLKVTPTARAKDVELPADWRTN